MPSSSKLPAGSSDSDEPPIIDVRPPPLAISAVEAEAFPNKLLANPARYAKYPIAPAPNSLKNCKRDILFPISVPEFFLCILASLRCTLEDERIILEREFFIYIALYIFIY